MAKARRKKGKPKGGRPAFEPTPEQRMQVSIAAGAGCSQEAIAIAIGVSKPTLMKHFKAELSHEAHKRRLEVIGGLYQSALNGSAAAAKAYLALNPATPDKPPAETAGAAPEGKKAQADRDARTAHVGNEWEKLLATPETVQ